MFLNHIDRVKQSIVNLLKKIENINNNTFLYCGNCGILILCVQGFHPGTESIVCVYMNIRSL
jgi:hypothetical protein